MRIRIYDFIDELLRVIVFDFEECVCFDSLLNFELKLAAGKL